MLVAIAQTGPVYLNREASVDKACAWIGRAAEAGAKLLAFPESWIPGYPAWLDACRDVAVWDHPQVKQLYARLRDNAVVVPGPDIERLAQAAREHGVVVNLTVHERVDEGPGRGTLFNTMLTLDADGSLRNVHRKLMPTYTERLIWGQGDGRSLRAVPTAAGRVGGLICWEHWMPPARQVLHESSEDLHIAAWPQVKEMNLVASRHYAFEGRCFVLATGALMRAAELPDGLEPIAAMRDPEAWALNGGSAIIGPDGGLIAGPVFERECLLTADLDLGRIAEESLTLDTTGHYARPDLFELVRKTER